MVLLGICHRMLKTRCLVQALPDRVAAYNVEDIPAFAVGTFVFSTQRKSNFRRLHIVGSCSYRAGVHFAKFEAFGLVMPPTTSFNAQCKHCFKVAAGCDGEEASSSASSISSESSSDSSWHADPCTGLLKYWARPNPILHRCLVSPVFFFRPAGYLGLAKGVFSCRQPGRWLRRRCPHQ